MNRIPLTRIEDAQKGIQTSELYKQWANNTVNTASLLFVFKNQEEDQQDQFVKFEEELAAFMGGMFASRTESERKQLIELIKADNFNMDSFNSTLSTINEVTLIGQDEREHLRRFLDDLMQKSHVQALTFAREQQLIEDPVRGSEASVIPGIQTFKGQMQDFTEYYANSYPERILGTAIAAKALKFQAGEVAKGEMEDYINNRFLENGYWGNVSNTVTTKAYHYSYLKSLDDKGLTTYTYKAVLDDATTEICRHLDGRVFDVRAGIEALEDYAGSSPNAAPSELPWLNKNEQEDIVRRNLTNAELQAQGVILPGTLHANCRSTLVSDKGEVRSAETSIF